MLPQYRPSASLRESDLTMPRRKPRSIASSLVFRGVNALRAIGFEPLLLRVLLKGAWLFWRLAYEISSVRFGDAFETATRGVTADLLRRTIPPGATVLDLGCGNGRLSRMAAPLSARVIGVDMSPSNIARAHALGVPANVEYVAGNGFELAAQRHYDVVLLVHVLEHLDRPDEVLSLLRDHSSALVVEVPNFEADPLNSVRATVGSPFYADADHVREYTPRVLREQLERNGFRVVEEEIRGASIIAVGKTTPA
ncbi:MAG TPA: methyltransferase domain-containing protein [Thermoanaerobaculia bacterium]|jgi:SAM-dependent methyltransferase